MVFCYIVCVDLDFLTYLLFLLLFIFFSLRFIFFFFLPEIISFRTLLGEDKLVVKSFRFVGFYLILEWYFAGYRSLCWLLFSFTPLKIIAWLLFFIFSVEESDVRLIQGSAKYGLPKKSESSSVFVVVLCVCI